MGYRNYIARLKKDEYEKIKNFTKEELYAYKDIKDNRIGEPTNGIRRKSTIFCR